MNSKGEILVVNQKGTSWSLPKGQIEDGENALDAAKREIYEETGVKQLKYIRESGVYQRFRIGSDGKEDKSESKTITMFLFKTKINALKPIDPENPEAIWVEKNNVAEILSHPKDKEFFLGIKDSI